MAPAISFIIPKEQNTNLHDRIVNSDTARLQCTVGNPNPLN
jgi:hypothetical protein